MEEETQPLISQQRNTIIPTPTNIEMQWNQYLEKDRLGTLYQLCLNLLDRQQEMQFNLKASVSTRVYKVLQKFPSNILSNLNYLITYSNTNPNPNTNTNQNPPIPLSSLHLPLTTSDQDQDEDISMSIQETNTQITVPIIEAQYEYNDSLHKLNFQQVFPSYQTNPYLLLVSTESIDTVSYEDIYRLDLLRVRILKTICKYSHQKIINEYQLLDNNKIISNSNMNVSQDRLMKSKPSFQQVKSKPEQFNYITESVETCWLILNSKTEFLQNETTPQMQKKLNYFLKPDKWRDDNCYYVNKQILFEFHPINEWQKHSFIVENSNLKNDKSLVNCNQFYAFISNNLRCLKKLEVPKSFNNTNYTSLVVDQNELHKSAFKLSTLINHVSSRQVSPLKTNELIDLRNKLMLSTNRNELEIQLLKIIKNLPQIEILSGISYQVLRLGNQFIFDPYIQQNTLFEFQSTVIINPNEIFRFSSLDQSKLKNTFQITFYNNYQSRISLELNSSIEQLVLTLPSYDYQYSYQFIYLKNISKEIIQLNSFKIKLIKLKLLSN